MSRNQKDQASESGSTIIGSSISVKGEMNELKSCSTEPDSARVHWAWYSPLVAALIFVFLALAFDADLVERWFSPDGHITDQGRHYLNLLRLALLVPAAVCVVFWFLRKHIVDDWRAATSRWRGSPSRPDTSVIVPTMHPIALRRLLWLLLPFWMVGVTISLIPGYDAWAARLTEEKGLFETLTVVFYLISGVISLRLVLPYLRRNSPPGLLRWWLLGVAAGCLFIVAEETNWGQLYFNYKTSVSDFVREGNYQNDVNFHNIALPYIGSYWANDLSQIIAACGGVLLPFLIRTSRSFRRLLWAWEVPTPPWLSQAYFFLAAIIPQDSVLVRQRQNIPSELREVTIAIGVVIWLWCLIQNRHKMYRRPQEV